MFVIAEEQEGFIRASSCGYACVCCRGERVCDSISFLPADRWRGGSSERQLCVLLLLIEELEAFLCLFCWTCCGKSWRLWLSSAAFGRFYEMGLYCMPAVWAVGRSAEGFLTWGEVSEKVKPSCLTLGGNFSHVQDSASQCRLRASFLLLNAFAFPARTEIQL